MSCVQEVSDGKISVRFDHSVSVFECAKHIPVHEITSVMISENFVLQHLPGLFLNLTEVKFQFEIGGGHRIKLPPSITSVAIHRVTLRFTESPNVTKIHIAIVMNKSEFDELMLSFPNVTHITLPVQMFGFTDIRDVEMVVDPLGDAFVLRGNSLRLISDSTDFHGKQAICAPFKSVVIRGKNVSQDMLNSMLAFSTNITLEHCKVDGLDFGEVSSLEFRNCLVGENRGSSDKMCVERCQNFNGGVFSNMKIRNVKWIHSDWFSQPSGCETLDIRDEKSSSFVNLINPIGLTELVIVGPTSLPKDFPQFSHIESFHSSTRRSQEEMAALFSLDKVMI